MTEEFDKILNEALNSPTYEEVTIFGEEVSRKKSTPKSIMIGPGKFFTYKESTIYLYKDNYYLTVSEFFYPAPNRGNIRFKTFERNVRFEKVEIKKEDFL